MDGQGIVPSDGVERLRRRGRRRFRFVTLTDRPVAVSLIVSVPMRWGEPDPELEFEVLSVEEWHERY